MVVMGNLIHRLGKKFPASDLHRAESAPRCAGVYLVRGERGDRDSVCTQRYRCAPHSCGEVGADPEFTEGGEQELIETWS